MFKNTANTGATSLATWKSGSQKSLSEIPDDKMATIGLLLRAYPMFEDERAVTIRFLKPVDVGYQSYCDPWNISDIEDSIGGKHCTLESGRATIHWLCGEGE